MKNLFAKTKKAVKDNKDYLILFGGMIVIGELILAGTEKTIDSIYEHED